MQVDGLGKRYGLLPSEVLKRANTFDLFIIDAALCYEQYYHEKQTRKVEPLPEYTEQELIDMFQKGQASVQTKDN